VQAAVLKVEDGWLEVAERPRVRQTGTTAKPACGWCTTGRPSLSGRRRLPVQEPARVPCAGRPSSRICRLQECLGPEGLIQLTELLSQGFRARRGSAERSSGSTCRGNEHARLHFKEAIAGGVFEPNRKPATTADNINATLEWMDTRGTT